MGEPGDHFTAFPTLHFLTCEEALPTLREALESQTAMLLKASHSMHFETLAEALCKAYD
jgi:UDP-N-acetylmuramyl pentapeptide synthase